MVQYRGDDSGSGDDYRQLPDRTEALVSDSPKVLSRLKSDVYTATELNIIFT
jgi:hypothetical protein